MSVFEVYENSLHVAQYHQLFSSSEQNVMFQDLRLLMKYHKEFNSQLKTIEKGDKEIGSLIGYMANECLFKEENYIMILKLFCTKINFINSIISEKSRGSLLARQWLLECTKQTPYMLELQGLIKRPLEHFKLYPGKMKQIMSFTPKHQHYEFNLALIKINRILQIIDQTPDVVTWEQLRDLHKARESYHGFNNKLEYQISQPYEFNIQSSVMPNVSHHLQPKEIAMIVEKADKLLNYFTDLRRAAIEYSHKIQVFTESQFRYLQLWNNLLQGSRQFESMFRKHDFCTTLPILTQNFQQAIKTKVTDRLTEIIKWLQKALKKPKKIHMLQTTLTRLEKNSSVPILMLNYLTSEWLQTHLGKAQIRQYKCDQTEGKTKHHNDIVYSCIDQWINNWQLTTSN